MEEKTKKILMFESDEFIVEILKRRFEKEGFEVKVFSEAPDNLVEAVLKEKPDIISMDIIFGGKLDGYEITEKLKADPRTKNIPIIGFDNLSHKEDCKKAKDVGMEAYYIKSQYAPSEYVQHIERHLWEARRKKEVNK